MKATIRKIGGYIETHKWLQYGLIWLGLVVVSVLGMNDNYHTTSWINRIIPAYQHGEMTIFVGTLVFITAIYNLFRGFHYITGNYLFNKNWKCFVCTLIFINLLSGINVGVIQQIRAFGSGVHAIYLERNNPLSINLQDISEGKEKRYSVKGMISLKNCSNETVGPFKVTMTLMPNGQQPGGSFTYEESYILGPKEEESFILNYEGMLNDFSDEGVSRAQMYIANKDLQMTLWDEKQQVIFYTE